MLRAFGKETTACLVALRADGDCDQSRLRHAKGKAWGSSCRSYNPDIAQAIT